MGSASIIGFTARGRDSGGYVRFQFTDMHGKLRNIQVPPGKSRSALNSSLKIDGSSIPGLSSINDSDMRIVPDRTTHQKIRVPCATSKVREIDYVICDIVNSDSSASELCPRTTLKNTLDGFNINDAKVSIIIGAELEFFLFQQNKDGTIRFDTDNAGHYYSMPEDELDLIRQDMVECLTEAGIAIESSHHEASSSQHEITLTADSALAIADKIVIAKWIIKNVASAYGLIASFMAKPFAGTNGSCMHLHQSIFSDDGTKNLYHSSRSNDGISTMAKYAIAGILANADSIAAFTNPNINSYKRLIPGFEAPTLKTWGKSNRSSMVRVPDFRSWKNARIEFRLPDSSCNPYLAINAMVLGVYDGIVNKTHCENPTVTNVFEADVEASFADDAFAPNSLSDAIILLNENQEFLEYFDPKFIAVYSEEKIKEIGTFMEYVTPLELERYIEV